MEQWDKTWKPHHLPMWAKKAIRLKAIEEDNWNAFPAWPVTNNACAHMPHDLFDHWGTVLRNGKRVLITQPYHNHDEEAHEFASKMGWSVSSSHPGPWHEGTWYYEFLP